MWAEPALLFRQQVPRLAVGAESRSDDLEKEITCVYLEWDAATVTALDLVPLFVQNLYHGMSLSLWYFPLVPHQLDRPAKLPAKLRSGHGSFWVWGVQQGVAPVLLPSPLPSTSRHWLTRSVGSTPKACVICYWGTLSMMSGLSLSDFDFRRVPKNHDHLPRTCPGSNNIMPSLSQMYCELTFRASSMFRDLKRWKSPPWSRWHKSLTLKVLFNIFLRISCLS